MFKKNNLKNIPYCGHSRIYLVCFILIVFTCLVPAQLLSKSNIMGTVLNASRDSTSIANIIVHLQQLKSGESVPLELNQVKANQQGKFTFTVTEPDTNDTYVVTVDYQGVRYYSDGTSPGSSTDPITQNIVVYDSTQTADMVTTLMHHIFIDDMGKTVTLRETRILNNPSQYTITKTLEDKIAGPATLRFRLPRSAQNFTPMSTRFEHELIKLDQYVYDKGIIAPGNRQVSYLYELPWKKNQAAASIDITHATRSLDVFVSNRDLAISSSQLKDQGPFTIRGVEYRRYGAANVAAGKAIEFSLLRSSSAEQSPLWAITLTSLILVLGLFLSSLRKSTVQTKEPSVNLSVLTERKKELIELIAALDINSDKSSNKNVQQKRNELFEELQNTEIQLLERSKKQKSKKIK